MNSTRVQSCSAYTAFTCMSRVRVQGCLRQIIRLQNTVTADKHFDNDRDHASGDDGDDDDDDDSSSIPKP